VLAIDWERSKSMKRILLLIVRGDRSAVGFAIASILMIVMIVVALALASPALAKFTPDSPASSDAEDAAPPAVADPPADVPIDGVASPAAAAASSASDDSAAEHSGWVRSDDVDTSNPPDRVLEVPQVANPSDGPPTASTSGQAGPNDDSSSPDQVGSINDYQDEDDGDIGGGYIGPGTLYPYGAGTFRANAGPLNPAFRPGYVPINPYGPNIGRPGMNGMNTAVGSTSPMLPGPRNLSPMPGGWWNRSH
jgi:hypothetical protein